MKPWEHPDFEVGNLIYSWSCWEPGTLLHITPMWIHIDGAFARRVLFTPDHDWCMKTDPLRVVISGRNRTVAYKIEAYIRSADIYLASQTTP